MSTATKCWSAAALIVALLFAVHPQWRWSVKCAIEAQIFGCFYAPPARGPN